VIDPGRLVVLRLAIVEMVCAAAVVTEALASRLPR
jgi:hypothetical protein